MGSGAYMLQHCQHKKYIAQMARVDKSPLLAVACCNGSKSVVRTRLKKLKPDKFFMASHLRTTGCHRSMVLTILLAARHK